ncbi:MAG TPA: ABC transporter ATP-binding protein [Ktedonobacterales bacterium]|nr:ABC transporter ATP-binding protein [Ktedonobacterales bacterium]
MLVRILDMLRPHWVMAVGAVVCAILATVFALIVPWLLQLVVSNGVGSGQWSYLLLASLAVLVVSALRGVAAYGQGYYSQAISVLLAYDLRNKVYDHLQRLSFSYHDESETGQLMSRLTADIEGVRNSLPLGFLRVIVALLTFGAIAVILAELDWELALVTLISVPILVVLAVQVGRRLRPLWASTQAETGDLGTVMQESLSGRRVVMSFVREPYEIEKYGVKNKGVRDLTLAGMRLSAWNQPLMILALNIVTVLTLWVGGAAVIGHRISLAELIAVTLYVQLLATPVRSFGFMITWLMRGVASGERLFEVLDTQPTVVDKPDAVALDRLAGAVRFDDVSFAYGLDGKGPLALRDITIDAQPGQMIALLGATGSGKSTILQLLPRFYDVTAGRVTVDGHDVRDVRQADLRRNIGFVLQDVFLFNATIHDNIAFGAPNATDEQIIAAAKVARLHDFVMALPDGYETWVGERGVTLSGGQKQRVAIARTILLDPSILVLDDSTSSVDMETEYLIQEALDAVMEGRTTFVVASRLRTIKSADQILMLDRGRIVERGAHASLLAQDGPYRRLYNAQLRDQEEFEAQMLATGQTTDAGEASAGLIEHQANEPSVAEIAAMEDAEATEAAWRNPFDADDDEAEDADETVENVDELLREARRARR